MASLAYIALHRSGILEVLRSFWELVFVLLEAVAGDRRTEQPWLFRPTGKRRAAN